MISYKLRMQIYGNFLEYTNWGNKEDLTNEKIIIIGNIRYICA